MKRPSLAGFQAPNDNGAEGQGSILIAGETSLNVTDLGAVLSEWSSTHTSSDRVANILCPGSLGRPNGNAYLQPGSTVTSAGAVNQLWGSTGGTAFNWFWYVLAVDEINRAKAGETHTTF